MRKSSTLFAVFLATSLSAASPRAAVRGETPSKAAPVKSALRPGKAVFAGGCFWCMETAFEGLPGVKSVVSGFSGGDEQNPTYEQVSSGRTGHAESVEITFDPAKISYVKLLDVFWHNIDPTQSGGQFCDHGTQYRSAIFFAGDAQRLAALASKRAIESSNVLKSPIVTPIVPFNRFWPAEEYHQDYYKKNPAHYQAYRLGCGRDRRLREIWGARAGGR